jgi:hypothetical protein
MARGERGSVFVESLIAAAIVAMALGAMFRVISDSAARDRAVTMRRLALLVAQSELDRIGAEIPTAPGQSSGVDGTLAWRVEIEPYADAGEPDQAGALYRVIVEVRPVAGGPDLVTLRSLRLGAEA